MLGVTPVAVRPYVVVSPYRSVVPAPRQSNVTAVGLIIVQWISSAANATPGMMRTVTSAAAHADPASEVRAIAFKSPGRVETGFESPVDAPRPWSGEALHLNRVRTGFSRQ